MVCMDFHKHYDSLIFIGGFLKEIVDTQIKVIYIAWF
jgi:hypothetical protein